ncbi:hypothetical protein AB0L05_02235 [Nonomuraea pusilla]|uniref:hypothetical protein n=1 Tax=Nonomuraea pusilla TaxID=46177 RepID=UPI003334605C
MDDQLVPVAGATEDTRCPATAIGFDGQALTVTDGATGEHLRLAPASLYLYACHPFQGQRGRHRQSPQVRGLALLDADGLVLLDLPGEWPVSKAWRFSGRTGIPMVNASHTPSPKVRAALARRAPGWRRVHGLAAPPRPWWHRPVAVGAGFAGLALMAYLASQGLWATWRALASVGRFLLDVLDLKWLAVVFSPALMLLRPVTSRVYRWQVRRGRILGPPGGPYLKVERGVRLRVIQRGRVLADLPKGRVATLLHYRYDDLTGLLLLDADNRPLYHLPGPWDPGAAQRFAERHGIRMAAYRLSREEYLDLVGTCEEAIP